MVRRLALLSLIGFAIVVVWVGWLQMPATVESATTHASITYEGYLEDGGASAQGQYDFLITLFDAATDGQPLGEALAVPDVTVVDGRFATPLSLPARDQVVYVEVAVRPQGSTTYTVLTPRQIVTPTLAEAGLAARSQTRTVSISPASLIRDLDSTNLVMDNDLALRWAANVSDEAGFYLARPADWDGTSPVTVRLFFALGGNGAGAVNWRLKLNTYTPNSGEWLTNPGTRDADSLLTFPSGPSWYRIYSQSFTLTDSNLADTPLWSFFLLRGNPANSETFAGQLYLLNIEVEYGVTP
ncbi:hypothetical protein EYB53_011870 [Candidatus Chloroploca sp. M-50]|uniref:Uncharacterized protein n=1 Tax=Candidatus Chloroploca mongolica TaxID=2528176 RepID=A0ABS4DAB9_9CHLR|nr:hypothetical protein [Candidatus Chloroploca mongolica]MBP1466401.1 hypothetical protein [Candidatus Chloroploca mongolica]